MQVWYVGFVFKIFKFRMIFIEISFNYNLLVKRLLILLNSFNLLIFRDFVLLPFPIGTILLLLYSIYYYIWISVELLPTIT